MVGELSLQTACWPVERLGEALQALASRAGLAAPSAATPQPPAGLAGVALERWLDAAAAFLGMEADSAAIPFPALAQRLGEAAPAVVRCPAATPAAAPTFLLLLKGSRRRLTVLTPDLEERALDAAAVAAYLRSGRESGITADAAPLLEKLDLPSRRRQRVMTAMRNERLRLVEFDGIWLLRPEPSAAFSRQVAAAGLWPRLAALAAAHAAEYICLIVAWWVVGLGAMQGRLETGWLVAWVLLLFTMVPLSVAATWLQGSIAIAGGAILKQRLLVGALRLDLDEIRQQGAGHLLGRVMESEAVESLALSGGFLALVTLIELVLALVVLASGANGALMAVLLAVWTGVVLWLGWRYVARNRDWTDVRLRLTHELIERMIGHRTRLAQQAPERWHDGEDEELEHYLHASRELDRRGAVLVAVAPRGWLLIAVAGLAAPFLSGSASVAQLAIGVGGTLLGYRAFRRLTAGLWQLGEAWLAWRQVAPLFGAGGRREMTGSPEFAVRTPQDATGGAPVLQAHDLVFSYRTRPAPVLKGVSLAVVAGDRILLEGESGGGKSTLASLLLSLRAPDSGLLLAGGLDRRSLGDEGWRRRVASAPQFHENHVITGTFAFNLLMSRPWPPREEDIEMLEPLCRELGLDAVLQRMPGGLRQMVGESGWQLSHGERSRVFLARALLQDADVVILDESFAALDPENFQRSLDCAQRRARSLLVIAHR